MAKPVYLDTSIFIEIFVPKSKYKRAIRALLKELEESNIRVYTSIITVQEAAVATFRAGNLARDAYGDINSIARISGLTKEITLTAAKHEAQLKDLADQEAEKRDRTKPETKEQELDRMCENRRRKWDCFHLATAQGLGCAELYTTDAKLEKRPDQLGLRNLKAYRPDAPVRTIRGPLVDAINEAKNEPKK